MPCVQNSLLKSRSSESLPGFKWHQLEAELSTHAPTLKSLLNACFSTKVARQNETYLVSFCAAMMFKQRRPSMNLLHKILSVILYSGHCSKQVYNFIIMSMVFITITIFLFSVPFCCFYVHVGIHSSSQVGAYNVLPCYTSAT